MITEDRKATRELHRILRPGGKALLQVPHREAKTCEDSTIVTPEERLKAFGQENHVRIDAVLREDTGFFGDPRYGLSDARRHVCHHDFPALLGRSLVIA